MLGAHSRSTPPSERRPIVQSPSKKLGAHRAYRNTLGRNLAHAGDIKTWIPSKGRLVGAILESLHRILCPCSMVYGPSIQNLDGLCSPLSNHQGTKKFETCSQGRNEEAQNDLKFSCCLRKLPKLTPTSHYSPDMVCEP